MSEINQDAINALMTEFIEIKEKIKKLKSKSEEIRTQMLIYLKMNDLEEYDTDDAKLTYSVNVRKSFNKDKAIEYLTNIGEDTESYFTESEYETLKIKAKGGKNNEIFSSD